MNKIISNNPLVQKIIAGSGSDDVLDMLFNKQLPFTEEEYLECLVFFLGNADHKAKALPLLRQIPDSTKSSYVEKAGANHRVAFYVLLEALNFKNETIVGKIIRNQAFPPEFLQKIASSGTFPMLEMLLENQIKLIAFPDILDKIDANPNADNFIKSKTREIREFYLADQSKANIKEEEVLEDIRELSEKSPEKPEENDTESPPEEAIEDKTMTALQRINEMSVSERIKLALTGTRADRMILIRDPNKMVSLAVIHSPKLTQDEVSLIVKNRSLSLELINEITKNREWTKNYSIILELANNPKTPVKNVISYLNRFHTMDLKTLARDKNVSPVVRKLAFKLQQEKEGGKK